MIAALVSKIVVEWPMLLPSSANARDAHWRSRHRRVKAQRATCALMLRANGVGWRLTPLEPGGCLLVTLTRQAPRRLDGDNLQGACKATRDEIAAFFHVDDDDSRIGWMYRQTKGPATVRVELEVLTAAQLKASRTELSERAGVARELARLVSMHEILRRGA